MSSHKFTLELSRLAQRDFRDILSYTVQMWGERQLAEYRDVIDGVLQTIAENPHLGRKREDSNLLCQRAGQHLIFYQISGETVYVVRLLHSQMDSDFHLGTGPK